MIDLTRIKRFHTYTVSHMHSRRIIVDQILRNVGVIIINRFVQQPNTGSVPAKGQPFLGWISFQNRLKIKRNINFCTKYF